MSSKLNYESYVFDPRPRYPLLVRDTLSSTPTFTEQSLQITAKRYWHPTLQSNDPDALTLIFAHGTGYHKEHWEPTLEDLFDFLSTEGNSSVKIREAWSIDCPNHGDAAVLNEEALTWGYVPTCEWPLSLTKPTAVKSSGSQLAGILSEHPRFPHRARDRCRCRLSLQEAYRDRTFYGGNLAVRTKVAFVVDDSALTCQTLPGCLRTRTCLSSSSRP